MITERELLEEKVRLFSTEECVYKLIEELAEALDAAEALLITTRDGHEIDTSKVKALLEELADVEVAGHRTMVKIFPYEEYMYVAKLRHGIRVQLRAAVEERIKQNAAIAGDGDA